MQKTKQDYKPLQMIFKLRCKLSWLLSRNSKIKKLLLLLKSKSNKQRMQLQKQPLKMPISNVNKHKKLLLYKKHKLILLRIKPDLILQDKMLTTQLTRNMMPNSVLYKKEIIKKHQLLKRKPSKKHKQQHMLKLPLKRRQDLKKKRNLSKNMKDKLLKKEQDLNSNSEMFGVLDQWVFQW